MVIRQLKQKQTPFTIYHLPFTRELARLRTYPQHTLPLLPLLRSRPGGVHKASVVRSPKSDNLSKQFSISHCKFPIATGTKDTVVRVKSTIGRSTIRNIPSK